MADEGGEQDKGEAATPFKLDRARRKGMVARGTDLGFLSALLALAVIAQVSGATIVSTIRQTMGRSFAGAALFATEPEALSSHVGDLVQPLAGAFVLPFMLLLGFCVAIEIIQNRGFIFTAEPLKPDFTRLNPAKGLKRLFSLRMLKELAKNIVKFALYGTGAYLLIAREIRGLGERVHDGRQLASELIASTGRLLLLFIILAAAIAILDQLLARREFARQMRMSKREVTREVREREGEPRQKRKRRQILAEILKQAAAASNVKGADVLIVNPTHYAVALRYRQDEGDAPIVQARGRNIWAQRMRRAAEREGITVIQNPSLARALYRETQVGKPIDGTHFVAVADIYIMLRRALRERKED